MTALLTLPVALPILGAAATLLLSRSVVRRRLLAITFNVASLVVASLLLVRVADEGTASTAVGGWDAPLGIVLVADRLSVLVLAVTALVILAVQLYAVARGGTERTWPHLHPTLLVLHAGMALALLTGDLFTLFVGFEVTLVASYVLLVGPGGREQIRAGISYIVANVVVSTLFLIAIAAVYAVTGSLNLAELAGLWDGVDPALRTGIGLLLLVTFATKAAAFPLFGWLPVAYRGADAAIAAVFAGLLTKLGVYALIRTHTLLGLTGETHAWVLGLIAGATMIGGVIGALAQGDVRRILSFHITSQIGYMLFGVALVTEAGLTGAVFYLVHHILVKTSLFLVAGMIEDRTGTGVLARIGGLRAAAPWLAVLFAIPALSLAGIPPFSGFVAKLALLQAGVDAQAWLLVAVSLAASLLTVLSMAKVWAGAFWGESAAATAPSAPRPGSDDPSESHWGPRRAGLATAVLVTASVGVTVGAGPLLELSQEAAVELLDESTYVQEVLPS